MRGDAAADAAATAGEVIAGPVVAADCIVCFGNCNQHDGRTVSTAAKSEEQQGNSMPRVCRKIMVLPCKQLGKANHNYLFFDFTIATLLYGKEKESKKELIKEIQRQRTGRKRC